MRIWRIYCGRRVLPTGCTGKSHWFAWLEQLAASAASADGVATCEELWQLANTPLGLPCRHGRGGECSTSGRSPSLHSHAAIHRLPWASSKVGWPSN